MYNSDDNASTESSFFYRMAYKTDGIATLNRHFIDFNEVVVDVTHYMYRALSSHGYV